MELSGASLVIACVGRKQFFKPAGSETKGRLRIRIHTAGGRVIEYLVQLEAWMGTSWEPAIRCDNAHGFPHEDLLGLGGAVVEKKMLGSLGAEEALCYAERHYRDDADRLIGEYLLRRGDPS